MRLILLFVVLSSACSSTPSESPLNASPEWTWTKWSETLLRGAVPGEMPPVPSTK
ncbi:MAG: hypothetical protein ACKVS6_04120 [Planctomycetota bacterium]